jgi:hypothetical protein
MDVQFGRGLRRIQGDLCRAWMTRTCYSATHRYQSVSRVQMLYNGEEDQDCVPEAIRH